MNAAAASSQTTGLSIVGNLEKIAATAQRSINDAKAQLEILKYVELSSMEQVDEAIELEVAYKEKLVDADRTLAAASQALAAARTEENAATDERIAKVVQEAAAWQDSSKSIVQSQRAILEAEQVAAAGGREAFNAQIAASDALRAAKAKEAEEYAAAEALKKKAAEEAAIAAAVEANAAANQARIQEALTAVNKQSALALKELAAANTEVAVSSRTAYEVGVLISEMLSGNFARMQRSIAALGNSTGYLKDLASGLVSLGAPILAVGAALAAVGVAVFEGGKEIDEYNKAILATGGIAGKTATDLRELAADIGGEIHNFGEARDAVLALAQSGKVLTENFDEVARGAAAWAELTGESVKTVVAEFNKLGDDPVKQSQKLNEQFHYLTMAEYEVIVAMQKMGDAAGAAAEAQKAFADAGANALAAQEEHVPRLVAAWRGFFDYWNVQWNAMKNSFDESLPARIAKMTAELQEAEVELKALSFVAGGPILQKFADNVELLRGKLNMLRMEEADTSSTEKAVAAEKAHLQALQDAGIAAEATANKMAQEFAPKVDKMTEAIQKATIAYMTMVQGWLAAAAANPFQGFQHGLESVVNFFAGGKNALTDYIHLIENIETKFKEHPKTVADVAQAYRNLEDAVLSLEEKSNPQLKIWDEYQKSINELVSKMQAYIKAHGDAAAAAEEFRRGEAAARAEMEKSQEALARRADVLGEYQKMLGDSAKQEAFTKEEKFIAAAVDEATKKYIAAQEAGVQMKQTLDEVREGVATSAKSWYDWKEAVDFAKKGMQDFENEIAGGFKSVFSEIGDLLTGQVKTMKDFWKTMLSDFQHTISQMIATALELQFLGPLMSSLGFSAAPYGGAGGVNPMTLGMQAAQSYMMGGGGGAGGGGIGGVSNLGGGISNLLGGSGLGGLGTFLFGGTDLGGAGVLAAGQTGIEGGGYALTNWATGAGQAAGETFTTGFLNSSMDSMMSGASGSWAGAIGSVLGGVFGGYELGSAIGGKAGGIIGGVGLGVAAYFVPVIGWIAGAAALINSMTGGGLFGTKYAPTGATEADISIGPGGGSVQDYITESKKKALFGGTSYKTVSQAGTEEQNAAADQMYQAILKNVQDFATAVGGQAAEVVAGTFKIATDKAGKQTMTSVVGGETFKGETQQQFAERIQAGSFLEVLDKMGLGASKFVSGFKADADKYWAAVQDFATATATAVANLQNGMKFMALGATQTVQDVMKFVEANQQAGESLTQTYDRLAKAQAAYNQFVGQFIPPTQYTTNFQAALGQINQQMIANIAQANALAKAAGAQGASEEDLAHIHEYAAAQAAAALLQLEDSAQQLAFSLKVTNVGTLQQMNDSIDAIIKSAQQATTTNDTVATSARTVNIATGQYGATMQTVAKIATDSINLMLGSLSTLNDQQKLQYALTSLQQGTGATREQVLQIGQRLYASSEAYVQLFNEVMQYSDPSKGGGAGKLAGGIYTKTIGGDTTGGAAADKTMPKDWTDTMQQWIGTGLTQAQWNKMSPDDKNNLLQLITNRDSAAAAQTAASFQNLAHNVADIAGASGKDVMTVLSDMKINTAALEKGLGLKSDAELKAYLENLEKQTNSADQNTTDIVNAITALPPQIAAAIKSIMPSSDGGTPSTSGKPGMRTARAISDDDATAIGTATARALMPVTNVNRNIRGR